LPLIYLLPCTVNKYIIIEFLYIASSMWLTQSGWIKNNAVLWREYGSRRIWRLSQHIQFTGNVVTAQNRYHSNFVSRVRSEVADTMLSVACVNGLWHERCSRLLHNYKHNISHGVHWIREMPRDVYGGSMW